MTKKYIYIIFAFVAFSGCEENAKQNPTDRVLQFPEEVDLMEYNDGVVKLQSSTSEPKLIGSTSDFGEVKYKDLEVAFLTSKNDNYNNHTLIFRIDGHVIKVILPRDD